MVSAKDKVTQCSSDQKMIRDVSKLKQMTEALESDFVKKKVTLLPLHFLM